MKKIINAVEDVERELVEGFVKADPQRVEKLAAGNVVVRRQRKQGKVALVSGGGLGHEPAHLGFLGKGMLDAVVAGPIFTSPSPRLILEGIRAVATEAGVLCIVKNYAGDRMNFEIAMDMAREAGIRVEAVVVTDDVALSEDATEAGRRGVAGTLFVHKLAGAKAEAGGTLAEVRAVAEKTIANVRTMGMAIAPCTVPAAGRPGFTLTEDEMEIGTGIHGEPGIRRESLKNANAIAVELLEKILADLDYRDRDAVLLVNGMGATPLMELYIVNNFVQEYLKGKGVRVFHTLVGNYMTCLDMAGFSLTLLRLDDELRELYEAPADTRFFHC